MRRDNVSGLPWSNVASMTRDLNAEDELPCAKVSNIKERRLQVEPNFRFYCARHSRTPCIPTVQCIARGGAARPGRRGVEKGKLGGDRRWVGAPSEEGGSPACYCDGTPLSLPCPAGPWGGALTASLR